MQKAGEVYCREDGSSYANAHEARVTSYEVKLWPSLKNKTLKSQVRYHIWAYSDVSTVCLDSMDIQNIKVIFHEQECKYQVEGSTPLGNRLVITLPKVIPKDSEDQLMISCSTSQAKSLTWGDFVFTQNQPIYCRSLFPCQDTPFCKATFKTQIILEESDSNMSVFVSGIRQGKSNTFVMDIPIPSYLFAFLIGKFEHRKINYRIGIVAEPQQMEACLAELDELELYLSTLEKLMFPYQFGEYNICILPRSFPYGGMENPIFTFASPSIITGDKSGTSVAVHEMAHSWTGNLISCKNWENFWMNEGFTVYFENAALRELNGEEFYQVNSLVEQKMLLKTIDQFGKEDPYSAMAPVLNHANPDDAYSIIPYYKGHLFLTYLEGLLGRKPFLEMLNIFLKKYARKSVEWTQFKSEFDGYVKEKGIVLSEAVEWDAWLFRPGYPPRLDLFHSKRIDEITSLSDLIEANPEKFDQQFGKLLADRSPLSVRLLQVLLHLCQSKSVTHGTIERIQKQFHPSDTLKNFDLLTEWFLLCLKARYMQVITLVDTRLLQRIGRMKFIRPIYRELNQADKNLALKLFTKNRHLYSAIANDLIEKDLTK